jgi:hypothetical protein
MAPELHVDPDELRGQAVAATALTDELAAALAAPPDDPECRRLHEVAARAARELTEVGIALFRAAEAARSADAAAVRQLRSL